jgi:hypothetical protein
MLPIAIHLFVVPRIISAHFRYSSIVWSMFVAPVGAGITEWADSNGICSYANESMISSAKAGAV